MVKERYIRNIGTLTAEEQERLSVSRVCIVGSGGIGGFVFEELLRAGVENITIVDGDTFAENNLNRQLLSDEDSIDEPKILAAEKRAFLINSDARINAIEEFLTEKNADDIIADCDVVIDALDSIDSRKILARACERQKKILIHGGIWGWLAEVAVILPGSRLMEAIYPEDISDSADQRSIVSTVAICASLQAAEALKILCGRKSVLENRILYADLEEMDFTIGKLAAI